MQTFCHHIRKVHDTFTFERESHESVAAEAARLGTNGPYPIKTLL